MAQTKLRWGIIGTGKIAASFAADLRHAKNCQLVAVASRTRDAAEAFGERYAIPRRHAAYASLAEDPQVDVAYIATPNTQHYQNSALCLQAGKAVLCEKPFTLNASEAAALIGLARQKGLFLMEAMWTRFLPAIEEVRRLLRDSALGEPRLLTADFGRRFRFHPASRLFAPELGGGALLDLGVYPVSLASLVFGPPARLSSMASLGSTGVDEQEGILLGYEGGAMAVLTASMQATTPGEATICGTQGALRIHPPMHAPSRVTRFPADGKPRTSSHAMRGNGLHYQAEEVARCLRQGLLESDRMGLEESLQVMQTMDALRAQWGLRYPGEA